MQYFDTLPKVWYDLTGNSPPTPIIVTNILARAEIVNTILNNSLVYYTYDVQDSDTPEIIAEKYYGDSGRHWIILLTNNIIDPLYDWVLPYEEFCDYLINKYGSVQTAQSTIDHYTKTITKVDSATGQTWTDVYTIDLTTYNSLPVTSTIVVNLQNGSTLHITTTTGFVYAYDAENAANEAKRTIKLIDKQYVGEIEKELKSLMSS